MSTPSQPRRFTLPALFTALAGLLFPKCPLCLAAYLSAAGAGASAAQVAAPFLLRAANALAAAAVAWLAARAAARLYRLIAPAG